MTPARFLLACIAAIPVTMALSTVAASWWYTARYLPRIAGED